VLSSVFARVCRGDDLPVLSALDLLDELFVTLASVFRVCLTFAGCSFVQQEPIVEFCVQSNAKELSFRGLITNTDGTVRCYKFLLKLSTFAVFCRVF
jgi:hypothetical protein